MVDETVRGVSSSRSQLLYFNYERGSQVARDRAGIRKPNMRIIEPSSLLMGCLGHIMELPMPYVTATQQTFCFCLLGFLCPVRWTKPPNRPEYLVPPRYPVVGSFDHPECFERGTNTRNYR
ncbi:hypothetical protein I7I50_06095 [Histoplasma capsulatum G186AR]|uniref:Uncharacterized protein n=1 Tax=Ajellomyces capsulatus TaxID=5037 RepID=A0A8H7YYN2_AJECA|nr:hypothetical protein I7I52_08833 [Histoplasma capsulatum]QSS67106.1 hypothetical protein I7I50_06095 [Histoplasma capsulatum G186AR]